MTIPSGARTRVAYIAEVTPGTTPATPAFQIIRVTGGGIRTHKTTKAIPEIAQDRNYRSEVNPYQSASVNYGFALHYGAFDDLLAQALFGSWQTNVLKNGTTRNFATFEETYVTGAATLSFSRLTMGFVDSFNLDITAQSEINGSFEIIGQKETLDTAIIASATYTAASAKDVMASGANVASLSVAGLTTPKIKKLTIAVKNSLIQRPVVDSLYSEEFGEGLCDVTGTLEMYYASNAHYQKNLDHGGGALSVVLGSVTSEKYQIDMGNIVFLDGAKSVQGPNGDVMITQPYRAKYYASDAASIKITRAVE